MPTTVHLPDGRTVNFPDSMTPEQIQGAMSKIGGGGQSKPGLPGTSMSATPKPTVFGMSVPEGAASNFLRDLQQPIGGEIGAAIQSSEVMGQPIPPLGLATGAMRAGRAVLSGNVLGGAREAFELAAPALKYEATKATLEHFGVPATVATPIALVVSGYKRGAKPTAGAAASEPVVSPTPTPAPTPAPAAPAAAVPVASAPPVPAAAAVPQAATASLRAGEILKQLKQAGLSDSEVTQAYKWLQKGVEPAMVWQRIQDARKLQALPAFAQLPTVDEATAAVDARNATGRWPE